MADREMIPDQQRGDFPVGCIRSHDAGLPGNQLADIAPRQDFMRQSPAWGRRSRLDVTMSPAGARTASHRCEPARLPSPQTRTVSVNR